MEYFMDIERIGRVLVRQSDRARWLSLKVNAEGAVFVTVPVLFEPEAVAEFIRQNILQIESVIKRQRARGIAKIVFGPDMELSAGFALKLHTIQWRETSVTAPSCRLIKPQGDVLGVLLFICPKNYDYANAAFQKFAHKAVDTALKNEAVLYLEPLVKKVAEGCGLHYSKISFRNMKSRWGSCSSGGRLCFNIQLMRLPEEFIRYVVVHELCHLVHLNHSAKFYDMMEQILPGARVLDRKMKNFSTSY